MFSKFATKASELAGSSLFFVASVALTIAWFISGPFLHWSDSWQLIANTATTLTTWLLVILIQHSQNKDTRAIQQKLDELIAVHDKARNELIGIERD